MLVVIVRFQQRYEMFLTFKILFLKIDFFKSILKSTKRE